MVEILRLVLAVSILPICIPVSKKTTSWVNPFDSLNRLKANSCLSIIPTDFSIRLKNENGYVYSQQEVPILLDEEGYATISSQVVSSLPVSMTYTFVLNNGSYPSPPLQTLPQWMDNEDNTLYLCNYGKTGSTSSVKFTENENNEINEITQSNFISVYPNPAKDYVYVNLPPQGEYNIAVYDIMGRNIYQQAHVKQAVMATDNYKTGVYLIKISTIQGVVLETKRITISQ